MLKQGQRSLFYKIHSWTGIVTANILFVVCFSGAIALFQHELQAWEKPAKRFSYSPAIGEINDLVNKALSAENIDRKRPIVIVLPSPAHPQLEAKFTNKEGQFLALSINPAATQKIIEDHGDDVAHLMRMMHTDLMLPKPWGRYFVGLLGVVMLFSVVTGIVMHRKFFKDIFKLRSLRSTRLLWSDTHKFLGVWGVLFHLMISFTGIFVGLSALIQGLTAVGAFDGDLDKARAQLLGKPAQYSNITAPMVDLDQLIKQANKTIPNARAEWLILNLWEDKNAQVEIKMAQPQALIGISMVKFSGATGEQIKKIDLLEESTPFFRAVVANRPLHYAEYGGLLVKLLYYLLGLGTAMLTISGILIWDTRRRQKEKHHDNAPNYLSRFTIGISAGMVVATAAAFWANKLIPLFEISHSPYFWITTIYFVSWILCLIWACVCANTRSTTIQLLGLAAFLTMGLPILNGWLTGDWLIYTVTNQQWYVAVADITMLLTGLLLATIAYRLNHSKS